MKSLLLITLAAGLVAALSPEARQSQPHRKAHRPKENSENTFMSAPRIPGGAPAGYKTGLGKPSQTLDKNNLQRLPPDLIVPDSPDAPLRALWSLRRQTTINDFFECGISSPAPTPSDCTTVINQVFNSQQNIIVGASGCLLFQFNSCWGFFCSLCEQLTVSTDFIGNQLSTVQTLCVEAGQTGAVVGEDPPQWDAGFINQGGSLPFYDVC